MKVIICGAGIAGLALAWWLDRDGWQVLLVERAPGPRAEGYMIDFVGSGYDVAELMGALPNLRDIQTSIHEVRYLDPTGQDIGGFDYHQFAAIFEDRVFTFLRGDLERVLHDLLADRVPIRYATTVDSITDSANHVAVTLSDGSTEQVDLLVGADGIHSRIRDLAFGPEQPLLRPLGYHTASYLFRDDQLRHRIGNRFLLVAVPDRQLGLYPTDNGQVAAWLVHRTDDPTLPADPRAELLDRYRGMGDLADRALAHCPAGPGLYYDQVAQIELAGWRRGRVTLVGDACQAVSLMAGQGASLAMGGAYVLADQLRRHGSTEAATAGYEQLMRPFVTTKQRAGRRTARWLVPSSTWRIHARSAAFTAMRLPGMCWLARAALAGPVASVVPANPRRR